MTADKLPEQAAAAGRNGHSAEFLGQRVDPPTIDDGLQDDTVQLAGSEIMPYTHFSLALSKSRRLVLPGPEGISRDVLRTIFTGHAELFRAEILYT